MTTPETGSQPPAEPTSTEPPAAPAVPEQGPKELREAFDRSQAENKVLRDTLLNQAFALAGIDTTQGRGKTMREIYDGDASVEEIRKVAVEKFEMSFEPTEPSVTQPGATPAAEAGASVATAQERIAGVNAAGTSAPTTTVDDEIAEAEAKGEWTTAMNLKLGRQLKGMGIDVG